MTETTEAEETTSRKRPFEDGDWESLCQRLVGPDLKDAADAAKEIKDRMEVVSLKQRVAQALLPAVSSILTKIQPHADVTSHEHVLRNALLEMVSRLPSDEVIRPYASALLETSMLVLSQDYEDNALLASKIMFDLHKNYRPMSQDQVQPYLNFVQNMYRSLPTSVQRNFHYSALQRNQPQSEAEAVTSGQDSASVVSSSANDGDLFAGSDAAATTPSKETGDSKAGTSDSPSLSSISPSAGIPTTPKLRIALKSTSSFRVLTECPLTVMLLFQLYPKFLKTNIPALIQLMMEALAIRAPPIQSMVGGSNQKIESDHKRLYYTRSRELVAAQVKTLSFLTYLLRGFADQLKPYEDRLATNVVSLMTACPRESLGPRKELLVATRHILATDFRKGFFRHVDALLEERLLLHHPRHYSTTTDQQAILLPLGYSTLADLVHHVRSILSLGQLGRVVHMFSRVLHDDALNLPMTIQITAVRLLLNVVDIIFNNKDPNGQIGRDLLDRILDTLVRKLGSLRETVTDVQQASKLHSNTDELESEHPSDKPLSCGEDQAKDETVDRKKSLDNPGRHKEKETMSVDNWMLEGAKEGESLQDVQSIVRSIIVGLKTVVWCITNYRVPKDKDKPSRGDSQGAGSAEEGIPSTVRLTKVELDLIENYIEYAIPCMGILSPGEESRKLNRRDGKFPPPPTAAEQQQMDVLNYFAACFTVLDGFHLRNTLGKKIDLLVETVVKDSSYMVIPRHLLGSNHRTSFEFCEVLLPYLVGSVERLAVPDAVGFVFLEKDPNACQSKDEEKRKTSGKEAIKQLESMTTEEKDNRDRVAATILELFERVMKSLSSFPENEEALRPHLQTIVSSSLQLSMEKRVGWPDRLCTLLRFVFRSVSAGKFEESYREILPMIPTILNGLFRIFQATEDDALHHVFIELCLTIPARLSSLLPHIPLLMRIIVHSLESRKGELVNLGLRTLEFWIDNLNPDFLYPILAKQINVCNDLMAALSSHLRPAPYPYGLLALRLLGKLGGKNRRFLRDTMVLPRYDTPAIPAELFVDCAWTMGEEKDVNSSHISKFSIPVPITSALKVLQSAAQIDLESHDTGEMKSPCPDDEFDVPLKHLERGNTELLFTERSDHVDLGAYCYDVVAETLREQASDALNLLCASLASILDVGGLPSDITKVLNKEELMESTPSPERRKVSLGSSERTECFKYIIQGLLFGLSVKDISDDAALCLQGLFHYLFAAISNFSQYVVRIDANGTRTLEETETAVLLELSANKTDSVHDQEQSTSQPDLGLSKPFGYFEVSGPFEAINPFVFCEALAEIVGHHSMLIQTKAADFFAETLKESVESLGILSSGFEIGAIGSSYMALYESFLESFSRLLVSRPWNTISGLHRTILVMTDVLGLEWSRKYELELVQIAFISVKNSPKEVSYAGVQAFRFFVDIFTALYGKPYVSDSDGFIPNMTAKSENKDVPGGSTSEDTLQGKINYLIPSDSVVSLIISELASTKEIVRLSARYAIKCHFFDRLDTKERERRLTRHKATIKRVLFTRSLRLLPLPEQVAVIEALTIVVDFVPGVIPISDQNLLAFLSEFLKLSSIADGEMSDPNIVGFVVDKNGFAGKIQNARNGRPSRHINAIYRRRECVARIGDKAFVLIPEELPLGVQLRVSAIRLFNTVIRRHSDGFFDADPSTPIGNIRPHVINLLFRSLVSEPPMSVCAAHEALQDVLSLSVVSKDDRNHSRLPKELLQTCIRPVLLNLRDYTRLSVPLLRGLARLLSLLSSWFNKTLGEKLMEHLQKWTEPEMIMACNIWKPGDEPIVAAGIVDLFSLLPHASHFVEPLVKTVIKLEACLHRFRGHRETSPYRKPLARYLNKQCQHAVSFFFQRLKNPMYSELFQDLVALRESETLRAYLSGRQCSVNILNICFERPLAIIRSEKSSSSGKQSPGKAGSPAEIMAVHGIAIQVGKQREALLREEIESKQKKLVLLQQEATRAKEALQARLASSSNPSEQKDSLEDAKRRHRNAQAALDKAQKDLNDCKQRYASEIAHPDTSETSAASIKMTHEALELQHQGLQLVETLMRYNVKYLPEHNDVVRAFRWLWRSKGRHLRLQHEERMPLRFHKESMLLGSLLVEYSRVFPNDVDILFELLRVFLQPTSCDFRYIRRFLENVVSNVLTLEKQKQALQRFFVLLGGEGPEETKVLSIQLIVLPMLLNSRHSSEQGDNRADFIAMSADGAETVSVEEEKSNQTHPAGLGKLVDQEFVDQFVDGVLFKNGNPVLYGDRLRVELFRISTLLIQDEPDLMEKHKTRVIKFSWGLLKSEDTSCKNWAYLNVCAYISAFDTPPKVVVQVYAALIRLHQHEGKGYVRTALSILLSSLQRRLEKEHMHKIVESTSRIIYEEGNNIPQLAHIWQTIVTHPDIYSESCCLFMKHMVNSLTRLGLPPNCPIENRALSLSIAELVLLWNERAVAAAEKDAGATLSQENRPSKRQKEGLVQIKPEDLLDLSMINSIANFLVRMKILLADTKVENRTKGLELETLKLLRSVMGKWKTCSIEPVHFEKVVSMCMEEIASKGSTPHDSTDKRGRERGRRSASSKSPTRPSKSTTSKNNSGARDEPKPVSSALLLACLEIFTVLLTCSPENVFLDENATVVKEILEACFLRARHRDGVDIRRQLKEFIVPLLKSGQVGQEGLQHVKVLVESFIIDESNFDQEISESAEKKDEKGTLEHGPFPSDDGKIGGSCIAFFSLDILREVAISDASAIRSFNSSLVAISGKLLSRHIHSVGSAQRQGGAGPSLGGRISSPHNQQSTPTSGILDEALAISNMPRDNIKAAYSDEKIDANITRLDCVTTIGTSIRCMITSLTLLSLSDLPYKFTRERHAFMKILGSIFDSSDNIQLLITASQIVGKWMVEDTGPLSRKEKITFLTKFASLDSRLVSPIMVQPLTELICHIIFSLEESGVIEYSERSVQSPTMMQSSDIDAQRSHYCFDTPRSVLKRCLMMCLMNANKSIRRKALSLYMRQIQERVPRESPVVEQVEQPKETQSLNAPMPNVIWELVHSDYEALSRRMWPVVFVDTLLFCCDQLSGVNPTSRKWIPCPNLPIIGNHTESIAQKKLSSFFDFVRNFSEDALRRQCLECIGSLAHSDQSLIQSLFESLMESAWRSLPNDYDRSLFIRPLERLLSHPYHEQQLGEAGGIRNSVQSLLRACSKLSPRPVLDPDLVVGLAGSYCTWHETIASLEHARKTIDHEEDPEFSRKLSSGIRHCMQQLGEKNVVLGLSMNSVHQQESTYVLSLDVYDMVKEAISGYAKLVELAESSIDGDFVAATDFELDVWEERWAHLQKEMCQSQVLSEYASVKDDTLLLLESSWKSKNWDKVASLVGSAPLIGLCEVGDPSLKMSEIMLAITRGKLAEVENLHAQTAQLCLQQWQTMPCIAVASQCHSKLLHFFHRLVEFRESGQIMVETMNHSSRRTLPDLQNLLSAWRHRLPNDYDCISDWDDIITWRSHMFSSITSNFQWSESGTLSTLHDRPWTSIRMAKTARKQGLREVAMLSLGKIVDSQLNVSDAFAKLREQILVFNNPDSEQERTGGLNLVNTTNLSFFDAPQKSELFRLKGQFLSSLSARSKANQAYCHAVQICQTYSRAWASWGGLCSSLGRLAEKQHNEQQQQQQGGSKEKESGNAKKAIQYLAQALGCYLEAIQCDASESSRMHLPKCLWMLSKDGLTPGMLCQHFEARAPNLPCWVWLPWCPQLLTSLYRTEATAVKAILNSLAKTYPQALYFPLRAFYLERRDVDRSKGSSSGTHQGSVLHSEELMSSLRRAHATLWSSLEAILEELIVKFRPSFEEELLSTIAALLDRAESHIESSLNSVDKDSDDEAGILTSISKTLSRISGKYFRDNAPDSTAAKRDMRTRKTEIFKTKYQPIFETDFGTLIGKGEEGKLDLQEFATKLRKWKIMLEEQLASAPVSLPLMESSQSLALFATEAPDLWPMSCDPKAATLLFESERTRDEKTNPSVSSSSAMTAKTASVTAALSVAHSASSEGQGGEYGGGSSSIEIPGQYVPNTVSAIDCRPSPELHAKLVRFDTAVLIVRRSDQLVRKVGMIGSDGRCHKFLLQFGTSSLVRADERTVQLCYVFDKIFRKDNVASRNFLAIYPSPVIPVAQRLRMAPEDDGRLSLDDVFRRRCIEADCQINAISAYRRARVKKLLQARKTDKMTKEETKEVLASIAKEVLSEICERRVDQHMLLSHVLGTLVSAENLFHFRRTFSSQLAINSLFQYALSVTVRTPAQFVINETTGQVYWPEFRLSYNNQGFLESQKVPFRMTPNVKELVGPMMMEGRFVPSVTMAANALRANMEDIDPVLRLLIRDDIISWYCSKSNAKSDTKTQELEMQLADRVAKNVVLIESKVLECSVKKVDVEQERLPKTPVDQRVRDLVAEASGYERLSEMDSTFHPWL